MVELAGRVYMALLSLLALAGEAGSLALSLGRGWALALAAVFAVFCPEVRLFSCLGRDLSGALGRWLYFPAQLPMGL